MQTDENKKECFPINNALYFSSFRIDNEGDVDMNEIREQANLPNEPNNNDPSHDLNQTYNMDLGDSGLNRTYNMDSDDSGDSNRTYDMDFGGLNHTYTMDLDASGDIDLNDPLDNNDPLLNRSTSQTQEFEQNENLEERLTALRVDDEVTNYEVVPGRTETSRIYKLNDFLFCKNRIRKKKMFLVCSETNKKDSEWKNCPGKAEILMGTNVMTQTTEHNHPAPIECAEVQKLKHQLLNAAEVIGVKTLHQIFKHETLNHPYRLHVTYKHMEPSMRRRRENIFPRIPQNVQEIEDLMANAPFELRRHYKGVLYKEDKTPVGILIYHDKVGY